MFLPVAHAASSRARPGLPIGSGGRGARRSISGQSRRSGLLLILFPLTLKRNLARHSLSNRTPKLELCCCVNSSPFIAPFFSPLWTEKWFPFAPIASARLCDDSTVTPICLLPNQRAARTRNRSRCSRRPTFFSKHSSTLASNARSSTSAVIIPPCSKHLPAARSMDSTALRSSLARTRSVGGARPAPSAPVTLTQSLYSRGG